MDPLLSTAGITHSYSIYSSSHDCCCICVYSDGVGRSGTFCALMKSINRFKAEQMTDVFQTINTIRTQKPGVVANAVRAIIYGQLIHEYSLQNIYCILYYSYVCTYIG